MTSIPSSTTQHRRSAGKEEHPGIPLLPLSLPRAVSACLVLRSHGTAQHARPSVPWCPSPLAHDVVVLFACKSLSLRKRGVGGRVRARAVTTTPSCVLWRHALCPLSLAQAAAGGARGEDAGRRLPSMPCVVPTHSSPAVSSVIACRLQREEHVARMEVETAKEQYERDIKQQVGAAWYCTSRGTTKQQKVCVSWYCAPCGTARSAGPAGGGGGGARAQPGRPPALSGHDLQRSRGDGARRWVGGWAGGRAGRCLAGVVRLMQRQAGVVRKTTVLCAAAAGLRLARPTQPRPNPPNPALRALLRALPPRLARRRSHGVQ